MSRKSSRRSPLVILGGLLALVVLISVNSLLPKPFAPAMTWNALIGRSGLNQTVTLPEGELQVHFLDVGNADSILVRSGEHQMLIDGGESGDGDTIIDYLQEQGVDKLDLVIATHPDTDHIGGLSDVLEVFPVEQVLMTFMDDEHTPTSKTYERLLTTLDEQNLTVIEAESGQQYTLGEATIDILGPLEQYDETNNMSVVSRITFGNHRFLLMGDAEQEAEEALIQSGVDLSADVLKTGHHGSRSSTGEDFLGVVSPTHAVISCGVDNRYGHPHPETLETLQNQGVQIWRTDTDSTIVMTSDGVELTIDTAKEDAA